MTTKELSEFTGKDERTVQRWIKKAADKMSSVNDKVSSGGHGKISDFTIDEVEQILLSGSLSKDAVSILMQNARSTNNIIERSQSLLTEKDIALISSIVSMTIAKTIEALDGRVQKIENVVEQRKALLPLPQKSDRDNLNEIVRKYASINKLTYSSVWGKLYKEAYYRIGINFSERAKNRKIPIIQYIEEEGCTDKLLSIAIEILK